MKTTLFRCDASISIGSGHVIRCRTLARELQKIGINVIFLCRQQPGDLITVLEKEFTVLKLPELPSISCDGLKQRELYTAWLGCTQTTDAAHCLAALFQVGISSTSSVVVDHYGIDTCWETQIVSGLTTHSSTPKMVVIDDLADRSHEADILLDQNFFGNRTQTRYHRLVPFFCRQLLGPKYGLLGPEYAQLHQLIPKRTELRRLLIFYGGVDESNVTSQALEALLDHEFHNIAVDVVIGTHSPHRDEVAALVSRRPCTTLHTSLPSLAALIARADLFVGASGATTWERFCLGCPSIITVAADNQLELANCLEHHGYAHLISSSGADYRKSLANSIRHFADLNNYRASIASLPDLCKGDGASLVAAVISSLI